MNAVFSPARITVCCQCTSVMRGISHQVKKQQRSLCHCEHSEPKAVHKLIFFSERELTFMFAICYRLSVVCHLSVVCNVRAHYSGGSNFRQYFYGIRYPGHPLKISRRLSQGNPSARGFKHKRGSQV